MDAKRRIIVGISGASAPHYGVRLLEVLSGMPEVETHLILSSGARATIEYEMRRQPDEVARLADVVHDERALGDSIASGTFVTDGMIVAPCSARTLAAIANGQGDNLIHRAADVILKERRKLVLMAREAPLSDIHLENMLKLSRMGVVIIPPVPAFYNHPQSVDDLVSHIVMRALDQFGVHTDVMTRWDGVMKR